MQKTQSSPLSHTQGFSWSQEHCIYTCDYQDGQVQQGRRQREQGYVLHSGLRLGAKILFKGIYRAIL